MRLLSSALLLLAFFHAVPTLASEQDYAAVEGVYAATIGGKPGTVTIARIGPTELALGLATEYLSYGLTYSAYDPGSGLLEAWAYEPGSDLDDGDNYFASLTITEGGGLSGTFYGGSELWSVVGQVEGALTDFLGTAQVSGTTLQVLGSYVGMLRGMPFRLTVGQTSRGLWAIGSFYYAENRTPVSVQFREIHHDPARNVLYLTNRNTGGGSFIQLRAQLNAYGLASEYIIGGRPDVSRAALSRER